MGGGGGLLRRIAAAAPHPVRRRASLMMRRIALAGLGQAPATRRGRPLVAGLLSAPSGLGTGALRIFASLKDQGYDPAAFDVTPFVAPDQMRCLPQPAADAPPDGDGPVIVHVNAPETPYALAALGASRLKHRYRIAYWAWECERLPAAWLRELDYFHECWAPSAFTAEAIRNAGAQILVRAVGYGVDPRDPEAQRVQAWRSRLAPQGETLVLTVFDLRSSLARKNPAGAVEAFRAAFAGQDGVRLVLKASGLGWRADLEAEVRALAGADPRIVLIEETVSAADMAALTGAADIYLSMHRSEGFGLGLAEALACGGELVATAWSGNLDFADQTGVWPVRSALTPINDPTGVYRAEWGSWAEPDPAHAAELLRAARAARDQGGAARRRRIMAEARVHLSHDAFASRLGDAFKAHARRR